MIVFMTETFADHCLIQDVLKGMKELSDLAWLVVDQILLDQIFQAFLRLLIEEINAFLEQFFALTNHFEIVDVTRRFR